MKKYIWVLLLALLTLILPAQIIETSPSILTMGQPITVYYNSDEDPGELHNYTGDLYAHTGVILSGGSDWQHGAPTMLQGWQYGKCMPIIYGRSIPATMLYLNTLLVIPKKKSLLNTG